MHGYEGMVACGMRFTNPLVDRYHGGTFSVVVYEGAGMLWKCFCPIGEDTSNIYHPSSVKPLYRFNIKPKYSEARLAA